MRIVVTGAGGFVGRRLVGLLADHEIVALDNVSGAIPDLPNVTSVIDDICDATVLNKAFTAGCDAVVHLATVPGGAAEQDPERARRVNVDSTMRLAQLASLNGSRTRFVFASSIAVFGSTFPPRVDDSTPLSPRMLYGAHKAMMEQWLATLTRRGDLDAISLRLSGVVARPRAPSGMKSAFLSDVFHALRAGESIVMPVTEKATCWLTSIECAASNFAHALVADLTSAPANRAVTLPALHVCMSDLVAAVIMKSGSPPVPVSYAPDAELEAAFGSYPPLATPAADEMGFSNDGDLSSLVERALAQCKG
jgi:nucleoside-diphosphate-sugar epimerase